LRLEQGLKKEDEMNRRELVAALAATAVAGEGLAQAGQTSNTATVMGSHVFDWNSLADKPNAIGSVRTVCSTPTATLENLAIHITTLNPGMSPHAPHKDAAEELLILRQGTVESLTNGEWIRVGPGSVIFNASNQLHALRNVGTEPAVYHVVSWKTEKTPGA
jgi:XRE family transcriptional regulator, regulator of sulfur utilization